MKPLDPDYFNKYYQDKNIMVPCVHCNKMVGKLKMSRHFETKGCQLAQSISNPENIIKEPVVRPQRIKEPKLSEPRIKELVTLETKVFEILDKYFEKMVK
jgi:hypothetical protein